MLLYCARRSRTIVSIFRFVLLCIRSMNRKRPNLIYLTFDLVRRSKANIYDFFLRCALKIVCVRIVYTCVEYICICTHTHAHSWRQYLDGTRNNKTKYMSFCLVLFSLLIFFTALHTIDPGIGLFESNAWWICPRCPLYIFMSVCACIHNDPQYFVFELWSDLLWCHWRASLSAGHTKY